MNESPIVVTGNVADKPERKRAGTGEVTKFRMAATERRFDGATNQWSDGKTLWVDVDCWNELGANVSVSVLKGDPVVVKGHLWTSEWEVEGGKRSKPVITAQAVGHDLSRGRSSFTRTVRASPTSPGVPDDASGLTATDGEARSGPDDDTAYEHVDGDRVDTTTGEAVAAPF